MVEHELQTMARQQASRFARQGMDLKSLMSRNSRESNRDLAVMRVKGILLLDAIAEQEKITVTDQEVTGIHCNDGEGHGTDRRLDTEIYESQDGGIGEPARLAHSGKRRSITCFPAAKKSYN